MRRRTRHAPADEFAKYDQRALFPNLPFDFVHDIEPIIGIDRVPLVMEVNPSFPARPCRNS